MRRIWQLHRTVMATNDELTQLRNELDVAPAAAAPAEEVEDDEPVEMGHRRQFRARTAELQPAAPEEDEVVEDEPEDWLKVGMAQLQAGDYAEAARSFSKALREDPESSTALRGLHEVSSL